ncbi:MAG: hypothetical protein JWP14_1888 [Frankiales bacterium]|jgi:uncharacterized membrane protein YeiH|nr:hypothetical protein [Frankiales bacterium]
MSVLSVLELLGVFVFALSGASLAVEKQLDLFGVLVLAAVTALGGGLLRDVLLGDTPPVVLRESRYLLVALAAGVVVLLGAHRLEHLAAPVRVFDAAGLGLFVATGTAKALHAGLGAVPAITLGCLTGIGGGIARDVLVGVVPVVLRRELYAVPAALGAAVVTIGDGIGAPGAATAAVAALVVFTIRVLGVWRDWHFPVAGR